MIGWLWQSINRFRIGVFKIDININPGAPPFFSFSELRYNFHMPQLWGDPQLWGIFCQSRGGNLAVWEDEAVISRGGRCPGKETVDMIVLLGLPWLFTAFPPSNQCGRPLKHHHSKSMWTRKSVEYTLLALYPGGLWGYCHGDSHPWCTPRFRWIPHHSVWMCPMAPVIPVCSVGPLLLLLLLLLLLASVAFLGSAVGFLGDGVGTGQGGGQCPNHCWLNTSLEEEKNEIQLKIGFQAFQSRILHLRIDLLSVYFL